MKNEIAAYIEARDKKIIRPQVSRRPFPEWCDAETDRWVRPHVVQLRRYLAMETDCGFCWDTSDEGWRCVEVKTFTEDESYEKPRHLLVGFAAFDIEHEATLEAVWIHPFYRNKGKLKATWPEFVDRYGDFSVSFPNKQMHAVLKAIAHRKVR